jgi:hypothetical protein
MCPLSPSWVRRAPTVTVKKVARPLDASSRKRTECPQNKILSFGVIASVVRHISQKEMPAASQSITDENTATLGATIRPA